MSRRSPDLDEKRRLVRENLSRTGLEGLRARDVMTKGIVTARPDSSVAEMLEMFDAYRIEHLLVVDEGRLVGSVSDRDVVRVFSSDDVADVRRFESLQAQCLMNPQPAWIAPDATLAETATRMIERGIHCLAVTEGDRPIGVVTTTDVLLAVESAAALATGRA